MYLQKINSLHCVASASQEISLLEEIQQGLLSTNVKTVENDFDDDILEEDIMHHELHSEASVCRMAPHEAFQQQGDMDAFVSYVFNRRFGWSESNSSHDKYTALTDVIYKSKIIELLDQYLVWFLQSKVNKELLTSLLWTIQQAQNKPVVRNQTVVHMMEWLKNQTDWINTDFLDIVTNAVTLALTDIWSAIRNACVSRLGRLIEAFSSDQLRMFFTNLVQICRSRDSTWQAREGAIMGMNTVIRRFQWIEYGVLFGVAGIIPETDAPKPEFILKTALCAFKDMIKQLNKGHGDNLWVDEEHKVLHPVGLAQPGFKFVEAYEAEGLLGACVHLVKQIPPEQLLQSVEWPIYFATFLLYLSHPASTVRQTTSSVFKFLVAKDSSNPRLLRLVLRGLSADWLPDQGFLQAAQPVPGDDPAPAGRPGGATHPPTHPGTGFGGQGHRTSVTRLLAQQQDASSVSSAWEWREGRLLAYELILQFLIKNHWLYTFGSSQLSAPPISPRSTTAPQSLTATSPRGAAAGPPSTRNRQRVTSLADRIGGSPQGGAGSAAALVGDTLHMSLRGSMSLSEAREAAQQAAAQQTQDQQQHMEGIKEEFRCRSGSLTSDTTSAITAAWDIPDTSRPGESGPLSTSMDVTDRHSVTSHRRAGTVTYGSSMRPHARHYSYFTNTSSTATGRPLSALHSNKTTSLLRHAQASETAKPPPTRRHHGNQGRPSDDTIAADARQPAPRDDVTSPEQPPELSVLLKVILYQTLESLADVRWELRRMGQQLLPCVVEVIRWYDMRLLRDLCDSHLDAEASVLTYGASLALNYSLSHAVRLQWLLQEPPSSWQDVDLCRDIISSIVSGIKRRASTWLARLHEILIRPCVDRLSFVAMDTIMVALAHFDVDAEQRVELHAAVVELVRLVFCRAHHTHPIAVEWAKTHPSRHAMRTPREGVLSCCLGSGRHEGNIQNVPKQVEKCMLTQTQSSLRAFIRASDLKQTSCLLPVLSYYIGQYMDDDQLSKHLIECVSQMCTQCGQRPDDYSSRDVESVRDHCHLAVQQITNLVRTKVVDGPTLKQLLDILLTLAKVVPSENYLGVVLQAIAARVSQVTDMAGSSPSALHSDADDLDLALRSNDIPVLGGLEAAPGGEEELEDEEEALEPVSCSPMPETQLLNVSGGSGGGGAGAPRRPSATATCELPAPGAADPDTGDDSDWGDWDEDEHEDTEALTTAMGEFLQSLQRQLQQPDGATCFDTTLAKMAAKERRVVDSLL